MTDLSVQLVADSSYFALRSEERLSFVDKISRDFELRVKQIER
ncbi:hypothetical protein PC116_g20202 [Phytophthora cactorum]|nr:hypothetical protein PC117_g17110 [Phytophthora cactorum]KAG4231524.1 hypothetical protein PC116_g20202 [Phytophthora cactorum]